MNNRRVLALVTALTLLPAFSVGPANAQADQCKGLSWQRQPAHPDANNGGSSSFGKFFAGSSGNSDPSGPVTVTQKGVMKYTSTPQSPTQFLQLLTGPGSPDRTDNKWGVTATDLGFAYESPGANGTNHTNLVFGDTFSCRGDDSGWRSNVILRTNDRNYGDGLNLNTALTRNGYTTSGTAKQFISAQHKFDNTEVTTIPTSAIVVNGVHYMDYMSVRKWGAAGEWTTNYAATVRSTDGGVTWNRVNSSYRRNSDVGIGFPIGVRYKAGNEKLQMSAFAEDKNDPNYVYRFSTPSGRFDSAVLGRALKSEFPNETAFEYWNGQSWVKDATQAISVINGRVSELSIAYSEYLGKYVALYIIDGKSGESQGDKGLVMRTADSLTGPWSEPNMLLSKSTVPDLYGGFILPNQDDQHLYYVATTWSGYNVMLMRSDLDRVVRNPSFDDNIDLESVVKVADIPSN